MGKQGYKKVKGCPYFSQKLNRNLFIHADVDKDKHTSISDEITGYRFFGFNQPVETITEEQIEEKTNEYIKHHTMEAIKEEIKRTEEKILKKEE